VKSRALATALLLVCVGCAEAPRRAAPPPTHVPLPATAPTTAPDVSTVPDVVPRPEPRSVRGNPVSYEVYGQRYVVLASAAGFSERGVASWYGPDFHGKNTSSGEVYDMYAMTAAHKTLPIPCYARITNLSNQRSIIVRINDRGPFVANRIVDLSYTAAARLDMLRNGTAFVELVVLTPGENSAAWPLSAQAAELPAPAPATAPARVTVPATIAASGMYLRVGTFASRDNALKLQSRLQTAGIADALLVATDTSLTRVRIGPLASVDEYDTLMAQLTALGIRSVQLARD
jgi:rare lipoprotein A